MTLTRNALPLITLSVAAACGGGSSDPTVGFDFQETGPLTVEELNAAGNALDALGDEIGADTVNLLSEADLIAQGSASYSGYMLGDVQFEDNVIVGRAALEATFTDGGSVDGAVTDMILLVGNLDDVVTLSEFDDVALLDYDDIPGGTETFDVPGTLTLSGGALTDNAGDGSIEIDVTGTATIAEDISITGNEEVYTVEGQILAGVADNGILAGIGELKAESSDAGFDLDTLLFTQD